MFSLNASIMYYGDMVKTYLWSISAATLMEKLLVKWEMTEYIVLWTYGVGV